MSFQIKIWGARGSLPAPLTPIAVRSRIEGLMHEFFDCGHASKPEIEGFLDSLPPYRVGGWGGNTPCIQVSTENSQIIIDGGSGARLLGYDLMSGPCGQGRGEIHILFTHFHWDHLIGLPFFTPIFVPGNKVHVYSVQPDLEKIFQTVFQKPFFPVPLKDLGSEIIYHKLSPREPVPFGDITVTPYELDHPDPCWGYRCESGGKAYAHVVDTECTRVSRQALGPDLPLYQDVDLMVFDAQYTLMESIEKINWGHAAASIGLDLAMRENIRRVLFMHHDPASNDQKVAAAEKEARRYYESQLKSAKRSGTKIHELEWSYAREGMVIEI